jgi:acyl transferase domain-containing protein/NAD(P)-dependent dehydrogenase (short-subunit alcohol dehydrogenase family)/acyl-CoA thioesterase FadM
MFYAIPYRILFHDTMAYGTHHFLTNFKFQCEARESLLFQERDLHPPQERHKLEDVLFLTLDAFSRSMNSVPVGAKVAILLSIEDIAPSSCRFCFRVVGEQGHPVACGFQTVATLSAKTRQMVAFPRFVHGPTFMRERLFAPDFQTRVLAGNTKSIFSEHVVQTGIRIASDSTAAGGFVPSVKWEADHLSLWQGGLAGKAFLFPGTGSLSWPRLATILSTESFRDLLARSDQVVRANLEYGVVSLGACNSEDVFKEALRNCSGLDQICNYLVSVHCARLLRDQGDTPDVVIGHSAGELSALAVAGAYSLEEGLDVVCKRVAALNPQRGVGGMLVLSAHPKRVESLIASAATSQLHLSVINHPDQVAVSGPAEELARLRDLAAHLRIGHVLLPSEYPFHSKLLEPAVERFTRLLGDARLRSPAVHVYSPLERDFYAEAKIADILPFHFVRPLDYWSGIAQVYDLGIRTFVDCSTGVTLKGIAERVLSGKADVTVKAGLNPDLFSEASRAARAVLFGTTKIADPKLAPASDRETEGDVPIAIVGLGCVLPGAQNPDQLWENVKGGIGSFVNLAEIAPAEAADFLSSGNIVPDKTYSLISGIVDHTHPAFQLDTKDDPSLAQRILKSAVVQAAARLTRLEAAKIDLVIGSTADGYVDLDEAVLAAELDQLARDARNGGHRAAISEALHRVFLRNPETASLLTANAVLNGIAREVFGPRANVLAIDAACASSLYAIELGMQRLRDYATDVAICGGVYITGPATWCLFAQFGGLSAKGPPRSFDAAADGVVFCPGAAVVALKRLPDALRDNDRIEAVIRGCGTSSDGKGASVTEPKKEGQLLAIKRAYSAARISMETVQFVEAHATATRVGDAVEFSALKEAFKDVQSTVSIGSIKSIIGHTGWAAGAASVIKVCRAMQNKTIPPHGNYSTPSKELDFNGSHFVIPTNPLPWGRGNTPRRAGVNGFGFGGTNGHAILEEYDADYHSRWKNVRCKAVPANEDIVVIGMGVVRPQEAALQIDGRDLKLPQRARVLPEVLECMDRGQIMAIMAADQALGCLGHHWPEWREEIGIILGFEAKTASSIDMGVRLYVDRIKRRLPQALSEQGYSAEEQRAHIDRIVRAICEKTRPSGRYTLPGVIPNLAAGRISNLFDLRGPNFIVDDAGASLMQALRIASGKLQQGTCKIVLAGGLSANSAPTAQLMASEQWRRGRPVGETAFVLALARADFARAAGLQPMAKLTVDAWPKDAAEEEVEVGKGHAYLMGAEGAREIEAALARLGQRVATTLCWRMPNGAAGRIRFSSAQAHSPATKHSALPDAPAIVNAPAIDYCSVEFQPFAARPWAAIDLRYSKVLAICDQPQALGSVKMPQWTYVAPSVLRIADAHPVDLASEAEFLKSCSSLPLKELDAVIVLRDLTGMPIEAPAASPQAYTAFDLSVAFARLLYAQLKERKTRLFVMCFGAWGDRALHPVTGLFGGMIKSLARELPESQCKAIYTDERIGEPALQQLHAEWDGGPDDAREVAYRGGVRHVLTLVRAVRPSDESDAIGLDEKSVVLATGGGRGITAKMVEALLQRYRCNVVILGRVDPNDLPTELRGADEQGLDALEPQFYETGLREHPGIGIKALKQRFAHFRACHEVQANLDRFRSFGVQVEYLPLDLTDAWAVDSAMSGVSSKLGRLDLVIHGAGIQDSRPFNTKTLADFRRVVSTKVDGLANLRRACQRHFPGSQIHYHLLTSTFSVLGNDGQADYGAANEMLNRTAQWRSSIGEPWSALAWLGWDSVGMARGPEYKKLGERRGLRGIQPEEGKELFAHFIASSSLKPVAVLMAPGESKYYKVPIAAVHPLRPDKSKLSGGSHGTESGELKEDTWRVSLTTHRSLIDHRVNDRPTLPWVLPMDFGVRRAQAQRKDFRSIALTDVRFDKYIAVREDRDVELKARTELVSDNDEQAEYRVELRSDFVHSTGIVLNRDVLHYAGNVRLMKSRNIDREPHHFPEAARFTAINDPYLDSHSPLQVSGAFRCIHDIRISSQLRCAVFRNNGDKLPPEFLNSSIPCLLIDALGRFSALVLDDQGRVPICVPVRGSRIWIAAGVNDRTLLGTPVTLRAGALRIEGGMMYLDGAEAIMPDGRVVLGFEDLVCRILGAVDVARSKGPGLVS